MTTSFQQRQQMTGHANIAHQLLLKLFSYLPLKLNHQLGCLLGCWLYVSNSKAKNTTAKNIALCLPHFSTEEQKLLVKKSLLELGKNITELGKIWFNPAGRILQKVQTVNADVLDKNKAMILLLPHLGCWELTASYIAQRHKIVFLYRPPSDEKANQLLIAAREGGGYLLAGVDRKGVLKLQRALKQKQWAGILPDHYPGAGHGVDVAFFNNMTPTTTLLVKLSRRNNAPVISSWSERLPNGNGYRIYFEQVNVLSKTADLTTDCRQMNDVIERMVLKKPSQYLWSYDRFRLG